MPLDLSSFDVTAQINLVQQLCDVDLESVLNLVEDLGVALVAHEGDCQALGSKPKRKNLHKYQIFLSLSHKGKGQHSFPL